MGTTGGAGKEAGGQVDRILYFNRAGSGVHVHFNTLIIKVEALNVKYEGGVHKFLRESDVGYWDEAKVHSRTGAMKDVFEARENELNDYIKAVPLTSEQRGSLFFINGSAVGLDCLSRASAYVVLHPKLVKSYALEAILAKKGKPGEATLEKGQAFLQDAGRCGEKKYKSVGLGWDHRFEGKGTVGSALEHEDHVIHVAFFPIEASEKIDPMAGYRRRRIYRI